MKLHKGKFTIAATLVCLVLFFSISHSKEDTDIVKPDLKFSSKETFKIVQFADLQDGPMTDPRTLSLMNKVLDYEKPDFVVLTGDNIDERCRSPFDVETAIAKIASPMEKRKIPWAVVFGNHDDAGGAVNKENMMRLYMSYPYNISQIGFTDGDRVGNYNLLIKASNNNSPAFNIYMLDSGKNSSDFTHFEWIKENQITWYKNTSAELKEKYNRAIPSLMFFHIPLSEWRLLWNSGLAQGEKNEEECTPYYNSGLFNALVETGDVKGVFVGHDHINDYSGKLQGITLGYGRSTGYDTYGKEGFARGARVFLIEEKNPEEFKTWLRLETDF